MRVTVFMKSEETVTISSFTILLTVVLIYQAAVLLVAVDLDHLVERVDRVQDLDPGKVDQVAIQMTVVTNPGG